MHVYMHFGKLLYCVHKICIINIYLKVLNIYVLIYFFNSIITAFDIIITNLLPRV